MPEQTFRAYFGAHQFARHLGLTRWQMRVGLEHGILPDPDLDGERWSASLAEKYRGHAEEVIARFGDDPPIGSARAATILAARLGLDVDRRDVEVLAAQGDLDVISSFRGYPVYLLRDLGQLDPHAVEKVVSARKGPLTDTVDAAGAATILSWPRRTFARIAVERDLATDRLGRYSVADIRALSADETLMRRVAEEKRELDLRRTRQAETRTEDVVRGWILRCASYIDRQADEPPDLRTLNNALRRLSALRTEIAKHQRTPSP
ncbi:hypothetical protein BZB76_2750 [Actinomadura pelletieri DSM 43383]|uniref:Uncharacterized protein n=1 Tax=Actinomadura pelletieri DSM 43383 TaxID=1120940 RepID=A0A495QMR9_9ACTN|nr:hypothetical protein [Actinomadura pelletieri]RKS74241.1 hypothetical protein BZB76_2750 [Actinomadura pelletieri DSM 43383]